MGTYRRDNKPVAGIAGGAGVIACGSRGGTTSVGYGGIPATCLLRYCAKGEHERFGRIEFAIGCDVTQEFKRAVMEVEERDWYSIYRKFDGHRMKTNQEWVEVCLVPAEIAYNKHAPVYRYIAIREVMGSLELPGIESSQQSFPFPTFQMSSQRYKVFGLVTNMHWDGEALIHWQRERCGKSEEAHSVMKGDLAGGKLPSDDFGENIITSSTINIFRRRSG